MQGTSSHPISGHVYRVERKRGPQWYAKYRLPDGRQVQKKLGPAWTDRGRPADGYFTKRTAEAALREILDRARKGTLAVMVRTGVTFGDAADEWLDYVERVRDVKRSTLIDYRLVTTRLRADLGELRLEDMTTKTIERWMAAYATAERKPSNRTIRKYLVVLHGIFKLAVRTHGLPLNPVTTIEKPRTRQRAGIEVLTPTEVRAFVRAAESEQDAAIFLTAAFAGLRLGELLGLRWRDVDFAGESIHVRSNFTRGEETTPKSGKGRVVPMAPEVAQALAKLGQRDHSTGDRDLVFVNDIGGHVDDHRMRRRFKTALKRAELRADFRFHDLRHTFGSTMIRRVDPRVLQGYMGHASITTTEMYLAFRPRTSDAQAISDAFAEETIEA